MPCHGLREGGQGIAVGCGRQEQAVPKGARPVWQFPETSNWPNYHLAQVAWLFAEVGRREELAALAQDPFGNFTLQKLLERGTAELRATLTAAISGAVELHTRHMYGCRVLQKMLEARPSPAASRGLQVHWLVCGRPGGCKPALVQSFMAAADAAQAHAWAYLHTLTLLRACLQVESEASDEDDRRIALVSELRGRVLVCVADQNGNHVIQKIIECVPSHRVRFVLDVRYPPYYLNLCLGPLILLLNANQRCN